MSIAPVKKQAEPSFDINTPWGRLLNAILNPNNPANVAPGPNEIAPPMLAAISHLGQLRNLERIKRALAAMGIPALRNEVPGVSHPERYILEFLAQHNLGTTNSPAVAGKVMAPMGNPGKLGAMFSQEGAVPSMIEEKPSQLLGILRALFQKPPSP